MLEPEVGFKDMVYNGYPTGLKGQRELAEKFGLDWTLLAGIGKVDPATNGTSNRRAVSSIQQASS